MRSKRLAARHFRALIPLLLALPACERGCLWKQLRQAGVMGASPSRDTPRMGIGEVDCPDGLARCASGVIEVSVLGQRPRVCQGSPEACACPWRAAGRCGGSCVAEGVELVVPADVAGFQLCAPGEKADGSRPFARPAGEPTPSEAERAACEGEAYVCLSSRVVACGAGRIAGVCIEGCAKDVELGSEGVALVHLSDEQALALFCARGPR